MIAIPLAIAALAVAQLVGWWLMAIVAFVWGIHLRSVRWPGLRVAGAVAALAAVRLGMLAIEGARLGEVGNVLGGIVGIPPVAVFALAVTLPALVALAAAALGAAVGRQVMFG